MDSIVTKKKVHLHEYFIFETNEARSLCSFAFQQKNKNFGKVEASKKLSKNYEKMGYLSRFGCKKE